MRILPLALAAFLLATPASAGETPAPEGAKVYFIALETGASVSSPLTIAFGLEGMGIAPAGTEKEKTGHHHLLIDRAPFGEGAEDDLDAPLPADDHHRHFGGGQTQVTIELAPGEHTLQLVLGDLNHIPHNPPVATEQITIEVE